MKQADCATCCKCNEIPEKTLTERCEHAPSVCSACISRYIRMEVLNKKQTEIACIQAGSGCRERLNYEEIKVVCDDSLFK